MKSVCRKNERKWKKTGLHVFYQTWKDAMTNYQKAVKKARTSLLSKLILANYSNPRILFKVIESVTSPSSTPSINASQERYEDFLTYFRNGVSYIRKKITTPDRILQTTGTSIVILAALNSLPFLMKLISQMKPATCILDFIPIKFL